MGGKRNTDMTNGWIALDCVVLVSNVSHKKELSSLSYKA